MDTMKKLAFVFAAIAALLVLGISCNKNNPEEVAENTIITLVYPKDAGTVNGTGTYKPGSTLDLTATANSGYEFEKWNDGVTTADRTVTVTKDATYIAHFKETAPTKMCTVNVAVVPDEKGGSVSGGGTYVVGTHITLTATANPGYEFKYWNDDIEDSSRTIVVTEDVTYTARFKCTIPGTKQTNISSYYYGNFYNNNTKNYLLFLTYGEEDSEGYMIGEGYWIAFELIAPNSSDASKIDTGTYNFAKRTSDEDVAEYTFLEGYYDEDWMMASPTEIRYYIDDSKGIYGLVDGGILNISKDGIYYTLEGSVNYKDIETGETGTLSFNNTSDIEFKDRTESSSAALKSSVCRKEKYLRKHWSLRK